MMKIPSGSFVQMDGETCYVIRDVDRMPPFFMSLISSSDLWMFLSSTGGLTAGRVQPEKAIFPYTPVDQIHLSANDTGSRTLLRVREGDKTHSWEPFNSEQSDRYEIRRSLYKNELGSRVIFEEENLSLKLRFSYSWAAAGDYGFVRQAWLESLGGTVALELLDGIQNLLPAGTPRALQSSSSSLVDAYKWNELDPATGLAMYALYARISDRAEPSESLEATTAFGLGLPTAQVRVAAADFLAIRAGQTVPVEQVRRGVRAAYFLQDSLELKAGEKRSWQIVVNTAQSQADVVALRKALQDIPAMEASVANALLADSAALRDLLARADGFQCVQDSRVGTHHTANVLFNIMRGGVFPDQYKIDRADLCANIATRNREVFAAHQSWIEALPAEVELGVLTKEIDARGDAQLSRLLMEYLPLVFSRRHGDPSRPWNHFAIRLKDEQGARRLAYQGNWRDIFQNWEALLLSYPAFASHVIAKFVNASTLDGYNPYRISQDGIDWEEHDPEDPWSNIGYWGDHQINYLLRLLELCQRHYPQRLRSLLDQAVFSYANVPYRIADFDSLLRDSKSTVSFDHAAADRIAVRCESLGEDGRLVPGATGDVYLVGLAEKLLVPLLSKLGNLVPGGGIWMNAQRPEWNDANNALVGSGLSMVTLCYMRRYVAFLQELIGGAGEAYTLTSEVASWLHETTQALIVAQTNIKIGQWQDAESLALFTALGRSSSDYRSRVYASGFFGSQQPVSSGKIQAMLEAALAVLDRTIRDNRRDDGLYHAYNLLLGAGGTLRVGHLYPMLEGQVAVLSSGVLTSAEVADLLEALFASSMYRKDQHSFMLYPDAPLQSFLAKNQISAAQLADIPALQGMLDAGDERIVLRDADGCVRFSPVFDNAKAMKPLLAGLEIPTQRAIEALYEDVFEHKRFTGRSGTMFAFEGRGSIYWHMVSKLLLATQEAYFAAYASGEDAALIQRLGQLYYRIRDGLGFNKSPAEYGAFPCDPYSHTPGHAGAQQPGMTGQVKEEVITRLGELGLTVMNGSIFVNPALLNPTEFLVEPKELRYLDVKEQWQTLSVAAGELAFTCYQVPFVVKATDAARQIRILLHKAGGVVQELDGPAIPPACSEGLFAHSGEVLRVEIEVPREACQAN